MVSSFSLLSAFSPARPVLVIVMCKTIEVTLVEEEGMPMDIREFDNARLIVSVGRTVVGLSVKKHYRRTEIYNCIYLLRDASSHNNII